MRGMKIIELCIQWEERVCCQSGNEYTGSKCTVEGLKLQRCSIGWSTLVQAYMDYRL